MHFIDANSAANGFDLAFHRIPSVGSPEGGGLKVGFARLGKIIRNFEPKLRSPDRSHSAEMVIHWAAAQSTGGGQLFIGIADRETPLIVLNHLEHRIARGDP